jgi:pimeloyl-ACP methyl ester carboxylesterase
VATTDTFDIPTAIGILRVRTCGTGPVAVMWHSLFTDSRSWEPVEKSLAEQRTLVQIDGPSHGGSQPAARRFSLAECAQAAVEVLAALQISGAVDWVGNAWGGHVGMTFAAESPDRCRSLIAFASPVGRLSVMERCRIAPLVVVFRWLGPRSFIRAAVVDAMFTPAVLAARPAVAERVTDVITNSDRKGLYLVMRSVMLGRPDLTSTLARIQAPTILGAGDDDDLWTPTAAALAASGLLNGRAATITNSRHLPPLEAPEQVIELVMQLWADSPGIAPVNGASLSR